MPAAGTAHAFRRRVVFRHRLALQESRFVPENSSDRQVSDTEHKTTDLSVSIQSFERGKIRCLQFTIEPRFQNAPPSPGFAVCRSANAQPKALAAGQRHRLAQCDVALRDWSAPELRW